MSSQIYGEAAIYDIYETKKNLVLKLTSEYVGEQVQLMIGPQVIMNAYVNESAEIILSRKKTTTRKLERLIESADSPLTVRII